MKTAAEVDALIYALGGGTGHTVRALAINRAIKKISDLNIPILVSSEFASIVKKENANAIAVDTSQPLAVIREKIISLIDEISPRVLIVDALPSGLFGELAKYFDRYAGKKIFIERILRGDYIESAAIKTFVARNFDSIISCEKNGNDLIGRNKIDVDPILIRGCDELPGFSEARRAIAVPEEKFTIFAVSTLAPREADIFFESVYRAALKTSAENMAVKFISPHGSPDPRDAHTSHFPAMELLQAADVIVGHAGYNLVHEALALRKNIIAWPLPRLYDDQSARLKLNKCENLFAVENENEMESAFENIFKNLKRRDSSPVCFENGAVAAAKKIVDSIRSA